MPMVRLLFRVFHRLDRVVERLNRILALIYISVVVSLITLIHYLYIFHLHPLLSSTLGRAALGLHTCLSVYLLLSVSINYIRCLCTAPGSPPRPTPLATTTTSATTTIAETDAETGSKVLLTAAEGHCSLTRSQTWRYCGACRAPKPPRAHHCTSCKRCFYKLCHHCPAFGRCIGLQNYPFYVRFVVCSWWGSLFAAVTASYLRDELGRAAVKGANVEDLLFFCTMGGCGLGVATGVLGAWHVYLVLTGQTTIEWLENVQMKRRGEGEGWGWGGPFSRGVVGNLQEAFGEAGWMRLIAAVVLPVGRGSWACGGGWDDVD